MNRQEIERIFYEMDLTPYNFLQERISYLDDVLNLDEDALLVPLIRPEYEHGGWVCGSNMKDTFGFSRFTVKTRKEWWKIFKRFLRDHQISRGWLMAEHAANFVSCDPPMEYCGEYRGGPLYNRVVAGFNDKKFYKDENSILSVIEDWDFYLCPILCPKSMEIEDIENVLKNAGLPEGASCYMRAYEKGNIVELEKMDDQVRVTFQEKTYLV